MFARRLTESGVLTLLQTTSFSGMQLPMTGIPLKLVLIFEWGGAFSSRMEAKDGSFGFDFAGTYTNVVPNCLIEYSFGDRLAKVEFIENPEGVRVSVSFDAESTHSIEQQQEGWQAILNNFARHVEGRK